jgi:PKD repeat protein
LSISLSKTEFCTIDKSAYKITVSPAGGTLTASAGGVDNDKQEFKPSEVTPGINKITYTLADGRSTSVDVKVVAAFDIDFTFEPIVTSPFSVQFKPSNTDNKPVSWNFGDGTPASTDAAPLHTYKLTAEEQSFLVKLTVVEGPCIITKEHSITLKKPRPQLFSIKPTVFCWKDDRVYPFTIDPAVGDLNEISNPDGLKLQEDAAGNVTIKPFDQPMGQTQTFNLNYKGIAVSVKLIVPDAGFTMNVQRGAATIMVPDTFITLKARQTDADNYRWTVTTDTGAVHKFTEKEVKFGLGQLQVAVRNQISIVLEISYEKQTCVTCSDKKDYNLTAAILKNHLNKGEFDNVTPA